MQNVAVLSLIIANVAVSLYGFRQRAFFERYKFHVGEILGRKAWDRLLVSAFLHANLLHLFFNMWALYVFGEHLNKDLGSAVFLLLYGLSLLGGDVFALLFHRNHPSYSAVGASGAISGVVFASIFLTPGIRIMIFPLPIGMPAWVFALGYTAFTLFGIRSQRGNIGHEAHLGGAVAGMLIAAALRPTEVIVEQPWLFFGILVPVVVFMVVFAQFPHLFGRRASSWFRFPSTPREAAPRSSAAAERLRQKEELDRLLDKISEGGLGSLSAAERERLDRISRELRESGRY